MNPSIKRFSGKVASKKVANSVSGLYPTKKNPIHNPLWQRRIMNQVLLEK